MNIIFNEIDINSNARQEYIIIPVFLEVDEIFYDPDDNTANICGRNESMYIAPMNEERYTKLFQHIECPCSDLKNLALFVNADNDEYEKLIDYARRQNTCTLFDMRV